MLAYRVTSFNYMPQLLQGDTEAIRGKQTFWKDIMALSKEIGCKLEQYRKEKAKEGFF